MKVGKKGAECVPRMEVPAFPAPGWDSGSAVQMKDFLKSDSRDIVTIRGFSSGLYLDFCRNPLHPISICEQQSTSSFQVFAFYSVNILLVWKFKSNR